MVTVWGQDARKLICKVETICRRILSFFLLFFCEIADTSVIRETSCFNFVSKTILKHWHILGFPLLRDFFAIAARDVSKRKYTLSSPPRARIGKQKVLGSLAIGKFIRASSPHLPPCRPIFNSSSAEAARYHYASHAHFHGTIFFG